MTIKATVSYLNKLNTKIPDKKITKSEGFYIYPRTYKNIPFYEMSRAGMPFARYFYKEGKWFTIIRVHSYMFGWSPKYDGEWKFTRSVRFVPDGRSYYNVINNYDIKQSKTILSNKDIRKYIDIDIVELLRYPDHKAYETAYKEGWLDIYKHYKFNRNAKTVPKQWGLPTFSKAEIHKLKTFISADDYSEYLDYINTAIKARKKFTSKSYFIKTWKLAHKRDIAVINKIAEEQRLIAIKQKKEIRRKLLRIDIENDIVKLKNPKTKKELEKLGEELRNCISIYDPKNIRIFMAKEIGKIAVEWSGGKVRQARLVDNMDIPMKIKKHIAKELGKEKQHGKI